MVIIVMGPEGAGKSTVGRALAANLGWPFVDSDDNHAPSNLTRMQAGQRLTDTELANGLRDLRAIVARATDRREHLVLACPALKTADRQLLAGNLRPVRLVYLKAPRPLLEARLEGRRGHAAGLALLHGQLMDLEEPGDNAVTLDASRETSILVPMIRRELGL